MTTTTEIADLRVQILSLAEKYAELAHGARRLSRELLSCRPRVKCLVRRRCAIWWILALIFG